MESNSNLVMTHLSNQDHVIRVREKKRGSVDEELVKLAGKALQADSQL
jgi:hypothetical protein